MDCPSWPELTFDDWGESLLGPLEGRRYPLGGTLELTERCNLRCVHCFISQPAGSQDALACEMSSGQVMAVMDQMADAGCLFLLLTGGEVFLRQDFPEIYRHAKRRGMLVSLFTNGTLLTPALADMLSDLSPFSIEITLYGASKETYERVTQVPGSFARCQAGIELLLQRDLPLSLKAVLLTVNRHELPNMQAWADDLGVAFRYDGMIWPRVDGGREPFEYRLSVEAMGDIDFADPERQRAWEQVARSCGDQPIRSEFVYGCGAGFRSFHVDAAGRLSACIMTRHPYHDLVERSFQSGWDALGDGILQRRQLDTECRTCTVGALCSQCPGWSQIIHGDNETPVDYVCELGRLRATRVQDSRSRC